MAGYPRSDIEADNWQTVSPENWSWLDHVKAYGSDAGNALLNLGSNLVEGVSPFAPTATQYGKPSLQVPPMLHGIADSYSRLAGTPSQPGNAYDLTGVKELDAPIQQDMSNVLLSLYGGNAAAGLTKPKGSLGAGAVREAEAQPIRAYHGTPEANSFAPRQRTLWATDSPELASSYALDKYSPNESPGVVPVDLSFKNPLVVDGGGAPWLNVPFEGSNISTDAIASIGFDRGHDGLIIRNIDDDMSGSGRTGNVYSALRPNTVRSATTGETLFSDTGKPSLFGSALATAGEQPKFNFNEKGLHTENLGNAEITYGVSPQSKTAELTLLRVPKGHRNQGQASKALEAFLSEADRNGYSVTLNADPLGDGGLSKTALERFYKSRGFVRNSGRNKDFSTRAEFIRQPRSSEANSLLFGLPQPQDQNDIDLAEYLRRYGAY